MWENLIYDCDIKQMVQSAAVYPCLLSTFPPPSPLSPPLLPSQLLNYAETTLLFSDKLVTMVTVPSCSNACYMSMSPGELTPTSSHGTGSSCCMVRHMHGRNVPSALFLPLSPPPPPSPPLPGPPGTGKTSLCKALSQKLSVVIEAVL